MKAGASNNKAVANVIGRAGYDIWTSVPPPLMSAVAGEIRRQWFDPKQR